jgi:RNA polymerase sigma-70 factor, ECF subfamily
VEETSRFLNVSPITVKRDWAVAKVWLYGELRPDHGDDGKTVGTR